MKKKILTTLLMVVLAVCLFAVAVSAINSDYRTERTYNYYDTDGNLLFTAKTLFAYDSNNGGKYRHEVITSSSGKGFAKYDENGTALTWYVVSDDKDSDKDFVTNIVVTHTKTLDGVVGNVDADGKYVYNIADDGISYSKKVVSANFFGTNVKNFDDFTFMATAAVTPNGSTSEYCHMTDGAYILALYLPTTMEKMPKQFCYRAPIIILEFENNRVNFTNIGGEGVKTGSGASDWAYALAFLVNLRELRIPEGVTTIPARGLREMLSLEYIKFPSTVTTIPNEVLFRSTGIKTIVLGPNVTKVGSLNPTPARFYLYTKAETVKTKYYYVPNTINQSGSFDNYQGDQTSVKNSVVFFFSGTLAEARIVSNYAGGNFKNAVNGYLTGTTKPGQAPITWTEYCSNKEYYDNLTNDRHVLVYDVPYCVAYRDGQHQIEQVNTYKDVLTSFELGEKCEYCSTKDSVSKYAPIIEFAGYSAKVNGNRITLGYKVNQESLAFFPGLSYGILATVPGAGADLSVLEPLNADLTTNGDDYVITMDVDKKYSDFNIFIDEFEAEFYETPFVMCVYVADGEKVDYLCHNELNQIVQVEYAKTLTYKYVAEEFSPKYKITFSCNDDKMGTLSGELTQLVSDGAKTLEVTAVAKEGYTFVGWSNGVKTPTIVYTPEDSEELVAGFVPNSTGLPVVAINTENGLAITSKDDYINCLISLLDTETGNNIGGQLAEIKGRGNSTWDKFDKKPYKFKFEDKQNLFGYGAEKTWVLLADARDYSLIRNMLALNAGLSMSELGYTSKGQSVELYLNGEYQGVYYLCEQIQIKKNRVNITQEDDEIVQGPADIGWLIEMDAWVSEDVGGTGNVPNYGITSDGDVFVRVDDGMYNGYVIKDPEDILYDADGDLKEEFMLYIQAYIKNSLAAVSGDDYNAVCELIDVKSFAQAYIIFDLFKNPDTQYSSVYFYKDVDGKLVAAPLWDFDMSIGNVTHKKNCGTNAQNFRDTTFLWTAQKNTWFRELLEFQEFKDLVGQELADNAANLRKSIADTLKYAREHEAAYEKNFTKWNLIGNTGASEKMGAWSVPTEFKQFADWNDHLDYIETYLEASLAYLEATYPAPVVEETPDAQ